MGKIEIEQALLGIRMGAYWEEGDTFASMGVEKSLFFDLTNRDVYSAISALEAENSHVDLVTVNEKLTELGLKVPNKYLIDISQKFSSVSAVPSYIRALKKERRSQELIKIADEIKFLAVNGEVNSSSTFEFANKIVALSGDDSKSYSMSGEMYEELSSHLESRKGKELFGYSFGPQFKFFDEYTKGLQKGRTYRIGAPSNLGKTQMTYSFINSVLAQGGKVAFFTLENDRNMTLTNLCANYQKKSVYSIERGDVEIDTDYLSSIKDKFFLIDDTYELSEIFSRCLEIKPDVVFLDYIGLVNIRRTDEEAKYTEYSKKVQEFVKKEKLCWVDLSNLPKAQEDEDSIKAFGGFYGSSFLRNNADVCIHLWRNVPFAEFKNAIYGTPTFMRYKDKVAITAMITKNRIGTARMEKTYKMNFDEGGRMEEASDEDIVKWKTGFV